MPAQTEKKPVQKISEAASQAAKAETSPAPVRKYRAMVFRGALVLLAAAFAWLTFLVKTTPSFSIDLQITRAIQLINFPSFGLLMRLISWPGFSPQETIIAGLIILMIYVFGLHWEAVMALVAAVFSAGSNLLIKDLVQRPRPLPSQVNVFSILNGYSFPSGHVMFYVAFFGFIWFLAFSLLKPSWKRSISLMLFGGLIVMIGVSRIYLGQHWASDVLGSYLLGSLMLVLIVQSYLWGKKRFFVHQPVAASEPQQTEQL